ncbi:PKD domain-containing protein [Microbulbifer taiwanensis]|uniref:Ig-like domain-containing protein n=1 Tax=Microbulbifer taiwanensis TaxID=986746 RepID=A0ABW1YVA1_9GAMM
MTLRLFNGSGNDMESVQHTVAAGATSAGDWAYAFAQTINSQSQYARVGVLDPDSGDISPVAAASGNRVYTQASLNLSHEIDIQVPDGNSAPLAAVSANPASVTGAGSVNLSAAASSDADGDALSYSWTIVSGSGASLSNSSGESVTLDLQSPAQNQTVTVQVTVSDGELSDGASVDIEHNTDSGGGDYDYAYPDGIGSYVPGETVVLGSDGNRYQCRPFPEGGWCNVNSPHHYAPGTGANWQDAWTPL